MPAETEPDLPEPAVPPPAEPGDARSAEEPEPALPMSWRATALLGGVMSLGVALVFGLSLLLGGASDEPRPPADAAGTVPSVSGESLPRATSLLAEREVAISSIVRIPSSLPPGQVVRTTPEAGSPAPPGTPVTVYVSAGSGGERSHDKVTVPYLLGVEAHQAQQVARQLNLRLELPGPAGRVTAQTPAPGQEVPGGTAVTVALG